MVICNLKSLKKKVSFGIFVEDNVHCYLIDIKLTMAQDIEYECQDDQVLRVSLCNCVLD